MEEKRVETTIDKVISMLYIALVAPKHSQLTLHLYYVSKRNRLNKRSWKEKKVHAASTLSAHIRVLAYKNIKRNDTGNQDLPSRNIAETLKHSIQNTLNRKQNNGVK